MFLIHLLIVIADSAWLINQATVSNNFNRQQRNFFYTLLLDPGFTRDDIVIYRIKSIYEIADAKALAKSGLDFFFNLPADTNRLEINEDEY